MRWIQRRRHKPRLPQKCAEAWNLLLEVLRESKFRVVSSYAVHTESTENPLAKGKISLYEFNGACLQKNLRGKEVYFENILPKVEESITELIESLEINDF